MSRAAGVAVNDAWDGTRADGGPGGTMPPRGPATAWQKVGTGVSMQMHYVPAPGMAPAARQDEAPAGKDKGDKDKGDKDKGDKDRDDKKEDDDKKGEDDKDGGDDKKDGKGKDGKDKKGDDDKDDGKDKKKSRWPIVLLILIGILAVVGGVVYYLMTKDQESTDDAYTEGNAVAMAPKVAGYVIERRVDDNNFVHAGDVMLRIDPRDYLAARDQSLASLELARAQLASARIDLEIARVQAPANLVSARAQLDQARANQSNAEREDKRQRSVDPRATTQTTVDQASTTLRSSKATVDQAGAQVQIASLVPQNIAAAETTVKQRQAQVSQAEANLAQAELNLSYTELRAPQDGLVTRRNVDVGTYAQAGQQVFYLVSPQTWIVANFKETQLNRMRVGQHVRIEVDAYPHLKKIRGHVDSIQQGSGARFTTFPTENATGNFVKIVRRVPVKIVIDSGLDQAQGLPLGLSVEPTVSFK